jgi:spore coat protein U-like protein
MKSLATWTLASWLPLVWCLPVYAAGSCRVATSGLAFGAFPAPNPANVDSTATLTVTCRGNPSASTPFTIALSQGNGGSFNPRTMASGTYSLDYNLYSDASHSTIWGDGTSGTSQVSGTIPPGPPNGSNTLNFTVYGRIPGNQNLAAGSYSDAITITIFY